MGEARKTVTIVNRRGLHARASAKFVGVVAALPAGVSVTVTKAPNSAAGGSILGLMMLGAAKGDTIELLVEGENADHVLAELAALVENGFGED
ncbi:HPr family phosphocarrier protein [Porphyrobacter sp. HT-58-2]|uniref:HPr family phosphocarrier protein n=1 Tax=Porphyrobacter sp. HT-58-2 TaxID=2023229 RepID=UPI000CDCA113|nr:HPr family phosphocarrier protein [Porphyrobacter sp. HT-58-2]AUX69337.1 HPr family phosphocarrier protein [Porphyrobacter sp. HT-58-2]